MKAVLKEEDLITFVSEADMIRFIRDNSSMEWNDICDYVRKEGITSSCGENTLYRKSDLTRTENFKENQLYWVSAFFEAHPFIEAIMLVFND